MVTLYDVSGREIPSESRRMMLGCLRNWLTDRPTAQAMVDSGFLVGGLYKALQESERLTDKELALHLREMLRVKAVRRAIANHTGRKFERSARVALKDLTRLKRDLEQEYALGA
jgi:hypothetical protein